MKKTLKKMLCGVCSAAMLMGAVSFSASAAAAFTDVKPTDYFAKPVEWAVQNGITAGVSDTQFGPYQSCTRAQAMTFLWAAAGRPDPTTSANFSDVKSTDYFAKAVAWAVENGITAGVGGGKFGANQPCTRGQIMTFLWRFGGSEEIQGGASFSDVSSSDYFAKPVAWAVKNEVTAGIGGGKFGPNQTCTRGQIMTMLWRADQIDAPVVPEPQPTEPAPTEPAPTEPEYVPPVTTPDDKEFPYVDEYEEYKREVAKWTAHYINEYRKEEGVQTAEWLPGLTLVAEYRADQTTIIFDHNTDDIREANNYYQYGEYVDMTEFTKPEDSYYSYGDAEALVGVSDFSPEYSAQEEGRIIADTLRNSKGHWSYIGNHEPGTNYAYIGVGVEVDSKGRTCVCVCVSEKNYDIGWVNPHA